jgi:hypothetical protein
MTDRNGTGTTVKKQTWLTVVPVPFQSVMVVFLL